MTDDISKKSDADSDSMSSEEAPQQISQETAVDKTTLAGEAGSSDDTTGPRAESSSHSDKRDASNRRQSHVDTAALLSELEKKNRVYGHKKSWVPTFGLLLLIMSLGGAGGWFSYQQWLAQQAYDNSLDELEQENALMREQLEQARAAISQATETQLARLDESEAMLQQAVSDMQDNAEADAQRLQDIRTAVNEDIQGVASQLAEDMQDVTAVVSALQGQMTDLQNRDLAWLNGEASYLMRLAQRKLAMEADVASAMLLLQTVSELLSRQDSLLASTARDNVRMDIQRLESLRLPDRVGIAERLNELSRNLDSLSLSSSRQTAYLESVQQGLGQPQTSAANWWEATLNLLRTVFVWRQAAPDESVSLMPDQELLIKQQMLLQIEQARLAVVQADEQMFRVTLDQLQAILQRYLNQDSAMAAQLLAELESLRAIEITATLPLLTDSLNLVRQLAADSATGGD